MPNEVKLLPCPFCAHEALIGEIEDHIGTLWPVVRCSVCPAEIAGQTEAKAITAWNTRPTTVVTDEVVERVIPREATEAMVEAAAATPGMKAVNDLMMLHQARGYRFKAGAFDEGSPLHQAWRAMYDSALASMPTVVIGEQPLQSMGVPASPSGHSRAEPEEVSALRASVPNADPEDAAWSWLESKYLNVEAGHDPNDRDYSADEMVDAYIAGHGGAFQTGIMPELVVVLEAVRDFLAGARFDSGVCCCGELIANHDPYHSNHAPRDELAYQASLLCRRIAGTLQAADPRGFTDWEHDPDEFDRAADEDAASADTLPKGQDAKQGLAGTEGSAVANGETPTPSSAQPGDA